MEEANEHRYEVGQTMSEPIELTVASRNVPSLEVLETPSGAAVIRNVDEEGQAFSIVIAFKDIDPLARALLEYARQMLDRRTEQTTRAIKKPDY